MLLIFVNKTLLRGRQTSMSRYMYVKTYLMPLSNKISLHYQTQCDTVITLVPGVFINIFPGKNKKQSAVKPPWFD